MNITPEDAIERDPARHLKEGHTLLIGAPGRGTTVSLQPRLSPDKASQGVRREVVEGGSFLPGLPGTPPLQHAAIHLSPESLDELRNSRALFTFRIPAEPGGGITAGLASARNRRDPHHIEES